MDEGAVEIIKKVGKKARRIQKKKARPGANTASN